MGDLIDVSGLGKLSIAKDAAVPLLVVFGGKAVGRPSGVYMWDFMNSIKDRFHIFVAVNQHVNGKNSYDKLMSTLKTQNLNPSQQILYLFSGGYGPGMDLPTSLLNSKSPDPFSPIFLVDIWMGIGKQSGSASPDFYRALVSKNSEKITYVHTSGGAVNDDARDFLVKKLGSQKAILVKGQKGEDDMDTHMRTNTVAVGMLP
jgi:hypothetical protein